MRQRCIAGIVMTVALSFGLVLPVGSKDEIPFDGRKKCSSCHKSQYTSWKATAHAKAMTALEAGERSEEKRAAGLDPDKDYTEDKQCVGCHTTGFGSEGGYDIDDPTKYLVGVTCESCHGPGSGYRLLHRKAGERFETAQETTPRAELAESGQDFEFRERCNSCHLNYEGSPWAHAAPPFTPFTPEVDPKYAFDFDKAVRDEKSMHTHYKLDGTFTGPPMPAFHEEFQATAKPVVVE